LGVQPKPEADLKKPLAAGVVSEKTIRIEEKTVPPESSISRFVRAVLLTSQSGLSVTAL